MIGESSLWKEDLLKIARRIDSLKNKKRYVERTVFNLEKDLFFAFYAIRKLIEAKKLSEEVLRTKINVNIFPTKGKNVTLLNWHKLEDLFDFDKRKQGSFKIEFLCNQVIHSYIFVLGHNENNRIEFVYLCSDYERNKNFYELRLEDTTKVLSTVANDNPLSGRFTFDEKNKDFKVCLTAHKDNVVNADINTERLYK